MNLPLRPLCISFANWTAKYSAVWLRHPRLFGTYTVCHPIYCTHCFTTASPTGSPRSGRFRRLEGGEKAPMATFAASPWCFEKSAAPNDSGAWALELVSSACTVVMSPRSSNAKYSNARSLAQQASAFTLVPKLRSVKWLTFSPLISCLRANINSLSNGLLLNACAHKGSFGVTWWIEHHGTEYRTQNPEGRACGVPDQALLIFREPAPDPMLVNLCACMGQIRLELEKLGLWEAAGDGDDLFDDDDPHWQPEQRPLADDPFDMPPLVI
ncbi:hypothetical protein BDZ88DRAFT_440514 [Geranomyces variabilis]|nr:hypothetical protein BDZ88DRAFT_440514 [Geranomyces variabilis]